MILRKPSFLERLTGSVDADEFDDDVLEVHRASGSAMDMDKEEEATPETTEEGELPVDMYHTRDNIVIRALIAGVDPEDLDIAITRDMVTIRGHREEDKEAPEEDYYHHELYWGGFARTILLPEEVLIDEAEAKENHGMLTIILPKVDKNRSARLKVKAH